MAFTIDDLLEGVRKSRAFFLKHLKGLNTEQWDWKPYAECKSIRETLKHLLVDDRMALQSLATGEEPDYETAIEEVERDAPADLGALLTMLAESQEALLSTIRTRYADADLDAQICIYGGMLKLGNGIPYLSAEDYYHAGQVAFIRMANDPAWDYYASIYGPEAS